jgi:site-specific recombinase XerD
MLDSFFSQKKVRTRMQSSPLGPYLPEIASMLHGQGYADSTIRLHLRSAEQFGVWLLQQGISVTDLSLTTVNQYRQGLGQQFPPSCPQGRSPNKVHVLIPLLNFLKQQGIVGSDAELVPSIGINRWLEDYDHYLDQVVGYTIKTRANYIRYARRLLTGCFGSEEPDWFAFQSEWITDFVRRETAKLQPSSCGQPVTAIRSLLRFLATKGVIPAGMEGAALAKRTWRHSPLPRHISVTELERVINSCDTSTRLGLRDRAVIALLARLGLRAGEIIRLRLDDIDWAEGRLIIRAGKNHCERSLPLSQEVGEALVTYLQKARPVTSQRELFLRWRPPFTPLQYSNTITRIVIKALKRAAVKIHRPGAHVLRHTLATGMARQGIMFKEIADVLGHRSIASTGIYAKLDMDSLGKIATPWPGGVQ